MNTISWFLYLSDLTENARSNLAGLNVFCVIAMLVFGILTFISCVADEPELNKRKSTFKKSMFVFAFFSIVLVIVTTIIPSKNTILLIAGSQITEQVANSPQGKEMLDNIKNTITLKLKDMAKEK